MGLQLGEVLIQCDKCPYKERVGQREDNVRHRERQAGRGSHQSPYCQHLHLRL
jgi:hypothetical protein